MALRLPKVQVKDISLCACKVLTATGTSPRALIVISIVLEDMSLHHRKIVAGRRVDCLRAQSWRLAKVVAIHFDLVEQVARMAKPHGAWPFAR